MIRGLGHALAMRMFLFLLAAAPAFAAAPDAASVAILFNKSIPESVKLAETYRAARNIPAANLVGLELPNTDDIDRNDYDSKILKPLREEFDQRAWWKLGKNQEGLTLPVENRIRFLAIMRGVPLRIRNNAALTPGTTLPKEFAGHHEASVDSELAAFGIQGLPLDGPANNAYFKSEKSISEANMPFLVMVSRIDADTWQTCERMIRDAIETEKTGLWGRAYVDIANKIPQGDEWLESVVKQNLASGIPTVVDRFNDTLPTNYPMTDAALYYGWYEWSVNGPFLNPSFRFKPGAVAMHLHSFSAEQIRDPNKNWSAALLSRGATCTIGNVYEPYLGVTHYFDILHKRLLGGATFAEAAWAAMPAVSWQGVVFGDPLYRPYLHLDGSGEKRTEDNDYRALRLASIEWGTQPDEMEKQLEKATERTKSGILAEAIALRFKEVNSTAEAVMWFRRAKNLYSADQDKFRQDFSVIGVDRAAGRKDAAVTGLQEARTRYGSIPESAAITAWMNILSPPPPPPADPTKAPVKQ
ncbi:MAG: TIGR03790 family protein [Verrucomicrobiales bacterium]